MLIKTGNVGELDFSTIFTGRQIPSQDIDTAKAHVSVWDVSRQPFFLVIIFFSEFAVREDIKKAGAHSGTKILLFLHTPKFFSIFLMDSLRISF